MNQVLQDELDTGFTVSSSCWASTLPAFCVCVDFYLE